MFLRKFIILMLLTIAISVHSEILNDLQMRRAHDGELELLNCAEIRPPITLNDNLKSLAGVWYVFAKVLSSKEPACIEVHVPEAPVKGKLNIQLMYKDDKWNLFNETLIFPWNESTQNGELYLNSYYNSLTTISDDEQYISVCRQLGNGLPEFRFLSRKRIVSKEVKDDLIKSLHLDENLITFIYQEEKCNSGNSLQFHLATLSPLILFSSIKLGFKFIN